jgi:hypothetical protein
MTRFLMFFIGLGYSTTALAQIPNYVPQNGLVCWWPFNGNANDESGNGNNGAVNGAALTTDRFGSSNKAYYFSGSNCATRIDANVNTTSIQSGLTISLWILLSGSGCLSPRILEFYPGFDGPGISQWSVDNNLTSIGMGSMTSTNFLCGYSMQPEGNNIWFHLVYTNDGISGKFYKNGILISSVVSSGNPILASSLSLGRMNHPSWDAFTGKLDDFGVWNRAL